MNLRIIQERLDSYRSRSRQEEENALREITQELVLAALSRAAFFKKAAFQGGTCLRIFYSLDRFSEDLDFILKKPDREFSLQPYWQPLQVELDAYGYRLEISDRSRAGQAVKKCFLKDDSLGSLLTLHHARESGSQPAIRIKLEVDAAPPAGSGFETKFLDYPYAFGVTVQDLPSLFAGKCHALLCREYGKGRDWYDFTWYAARKVPINFRFLSAALAQSGPWAGKVDAIEKDWFRAEMKKKIGSIDMSAMKDELERFLKPEALDSLQVWNRDFFLDRLEKVLNG
jgi:predicted nucleotidyltransferase component of viral defense system